MINFEVNLLQKLRKALIAEKGTLARSRCEAEKCQIRVPRSATLPGNKHE